MTTESEKTLVHTQEDNAVSARVLLTNRTHKRIHGFVCYEVELVATKDNRTIMTTSIWGRDNDRPEYILAVGIADIRDYERGALYTKKEIAMSTAERSSLKEMLIKARANALAKPVTEKVG